MTNTTTEHRELNWFGLSIETIAAQYETDHVLAEWGAYNPNAGYSFPPKSPMPHYFWAAWAAELEQADLDREQYEADAWALLEENAYGRK